MEIKKKKATVYPFGIEFSPIIRHKKLFKDLDIISLISPKGWGLNGKDAGQADKGEDTGITVEGDLQNSLDNSDTLIIADCKTNDNFKQKILDNIDMAIQKKKDIVCTLQLEQNVLVNIKNKCQDKNVDFKHFCNNIQPLEYKQENLLEIGVPIVFVAGLTECTNKFEIQLSLREQLIDMGYSVSQIGTRNYSEIMGFHSIPDFMFNNQVSEVSKIVQFNRFVKNIELVEGPDVIIIGIPGGLMPFNKDMTNKFGIQAFLISHAVSPDFTIVSVLYDDIDPKYFSLLDTSFKYKYGFNVDCFNISNSQFDLIDSSGYKKLCFNYFDTFTVNRIILEKYRNCNIPVFNILSKNDSKMLSELLINTLSEFSSREQIGIGGLK